MWHSVGYVGMALFYIGGTSVVLVSMWFFQRLLRRDVRVANVPRLVMQMQSLVMFAIALSGFGAGLLLVSLGFLYGQRTLFFPLGFGMVGLSLLIAAYAVHWFRGRF